MPNFENNQIVFSDDEWARFLTHARMPDPATVERRDAFFASLKNDAWTQENGVDSLEISDDDFCCPKKSTFSLNYTLDVVGIFNPDKKPLHVPNTFIECESSTFMDDWCA